MPLRRLRDRWSLGAWLGERTTELPGRYRPSLMVEVWTALLLYGGGWLADLKLLAAGGPAGPSAGRLCSLRRRGPLAGAPARVGPPVPDCRSRRWAA